MSIPERHLRVLVVDDDPDDHLLTEGTLREAKRARFVVTHVYSAAEARPRMLSGEFDICLLDYMLGSEDGVNLFQSLAAEGYATPTILLSGHDDEELAERVLHAGLADYLEKGRIDAPLLERAILYALERNADRQEIVALNHSLEQRVRERTSELESFCYSVSHDLRAPLRAINATSAILLEDYGALLPSSAREEIDRQAEASARLGRLIDDLLQFVRLGQTTVKPVAFDISALAHSVAEDLRLSVSIQEGLQANGDPSLVRMLLVNLFDNAAKFCGGNEPCIEFGRDARAFFVRDHGIGFDPKYAHKLFEPFERLHREGDYPGTGIGLANVKRVVERHGGKVWGEGRLGDGATFWFSLSELSPVGDRS